VRAVHDRFGYGEEASERQWEQFHDRFDLAKQPNEPFRFHWIVEFDPYDPTSTPKKRTALGRVKHEGATTAIAPGGQVALYSGDDERFEYAYKFVTAGSYDPADRAANLDLLDEGTLYVARFNDDGSGDWLPLVHGEGPLTEENGFTSQAEVLVKTRLAADALGATKMDRPEDFETNPVTGKVYLVCTNNNQRTLEQADAANPRPNNLAGHIVEITEDNDDHAATSFTWDLFIIAGDATDSGTWYGGVDAGLVSPLAAPDNLTFDNDGNIWISTDGMSNNLPGNDGLFAALDRGRGARADAPVLQHRPRRGVLRADLQPGQLRPLGFGPAPRRGRNARPAGQPLAGRRPSPTPVGGSDYERERHGPIGRRG
jgi:secreted PhoX family phosphatase